MVLQEVRHHLIKHYYYYYYYYDYYYYYFTKKDSMRYTNYKKMFATTCGVHKPPYYTTQEDWLNDER